MENRTSGYLLEVDDQDITKRIVLKKCVLDPSGKTIEAEVDKKDGPCQDLQGGMEGRLYTEKESYPVVIEKASKFPALRLRKVTPRKNVRVDTRLPMMTKQISPQELPDILQNGVSNWPILGESIADKLLNEGQRESSHIYKEIETTFPSLYRILADMNSKLDLLLFIIGNDEYRALLMSPPQKVNISGSGLAFYSDQLCKAGEYIVAKMVLPLSPMAFVELLCEVVSCSVSNQHLDEKTIYRVGAKYLLISDESREKIIRYVFQRQREILRERNGRL